MRLIDFNFGEYDARQEFLRTQEYFIRTFIDPISFSLPTHSNRKNYIMVRQKELGKLPVNSTSKTPKLKLKAI